MGQRRSCAQSDLEVGAQWVRCWAGTGGLHSHTLTGARDHTGGSWLPFLLALTEFFLGQPIHYFSGKEVESNLPKTSLPSEITVI